MAKIWMLLLVMIMCTCVTAQLAQKTIVRAGDDIGPAISPTGHYRFAQFTEGIVTMKHGSKYKARLNFHICNGEMQFIDSKGDTLQIAQAEDVDNIHIGANTEFTFSEKAYYELVGESPAGKLGKRIRIQIANDRKTAFGQSDPTGSHSLVNDITYGQLNYVLAYDVEVKKTTTYFWIDSENKAVPATPKNSLKLVKKDKQSNLQAFIDENKINFNNEEDLRKLLAFAATL